MDLCEWKITDTDENTWESECGLLWQFMDGSPTDNGIVYCPRCGREMEDDKEARVTKAMSKKVKRELYEVNNGGQLSEGIMYKCPSCDNQDTIWDITGDGMNYCGECGQRLDWEGWSDEI